MTHAAAAANADAIIVPMDRTAWRVIDVPERGTTYAYDAPSPSPAAHTVVLLHGWTATGSTNWDATIAALAERHRVVALDHRGHGRGISGPDPFSLEHCADDVAALLGVLGVRRAIFVGYSMGGPIAQLIWRRHPHLVHGLILCATAADFRQPRLAERLARATESLWQATEAMRRALPVPRRVVSHVLATSPVKHEMLEAMASHDHDAIHAAGAAIRRFCSADWIPDVDVPTVVVLTERDRVVRPSRQRELATLIPGARTITLDTGHLAPFRQPQLFAAAVTEACDSIDPPTARATLRRVARRTLRRFSRRARAAARSSSPGGDR